MQEYCLIMVHLILSLLAASWVKDLGLEVETLEEPLHVNSPLGTMVSID